MPKKIAVLDSTLRDGAQSEGISFSIADKMAITSLLDSLGVTYIEAGSPFSNPKDAEFFQRKSELKLKNSVLVAFGSTCRAGVSAAGSESLNALLKSGTPTVTIFGKCHRRHVYEILGTDGSENIRMITESVRFLTENGREVFFDAEHFYEGYRFDPRFAMDMLRAAAAGGARALVLCDTTGGIYPDEARSITAEVCRAFPELEIGVHMHNDNGMATANTIFGVAGGATQVQGALLGIGERCGNAKLAEIIADLQLTADKHSITCGGHTDKHNALESGYDTAPERDSENTGGYLLIPDCTMLTSTSHAVAEILNTSVRRNEPYIGRSAFAHKAGVHVDAVLKLPETYEQIKPEAVGNQRRLLVSEVAGRGALLNSLKKLLPDADKASPEAIKIMERLKQLEHDGYQFEGAQASLELMAQRCLGRYEPSFELRNYRIICQNPHDPDCSAAAMVKVRVGGSEVLRSAEGQGPVNALDKALRLALKVFFPCIAKMRLTDYKVRVMDSKDATAAGVRVVITSSDGHSEWSTVGVSSDIIEASFAALCDSVEYCIQCIQ